MSDENEERDEYFKYVDEIVQDMQDLFVRHDALVQEYSRAMEYIQLRDWRQGYVQWVAVDGKMEGRDDGDSSD